MTLSIEIDAPYLDILNAEASNLGLPVEELVGQILQGHATKRRNWSRVASDAEFRAAMEGTLRDYDEAYRRLAK